MIVGLLADSDASLVHSRFPRYCCEMSASASRRDNTDCSLARSAWKSVPRKESSRRVRYDRAQLIPEVFLVENVRRVFLGKVKQLFLKGSSPIMFELLLDVMDRFIQF
jgi:hypothetical protein